MNTPMRSALALLTLSLTLGCGESPPCTDCTESDMGTQLLDGAVGDLGGNGGQDAGEDGGAACSVTDCPPTTCLEAYERETCPAFRTCADTAAGPRCELWCEPGYEAETVYGPCAECPSGACSLSELCSAGGTVAGSCSAGHRECVDRDNGAACGACVDGYQEDTATGFCVPASACGTMQCAAGELPRPDDTGDNCQCVAAPCASGSALYENPPPPAEPSCRTCNDVFCRPESGGIGHYGWTDQLGRCVCMLEEGWYWPTDGSRVPNRCDDDGDGWMAASAWDAWSAAGAIGDVTQLACRPQFVDRVELRNEYGQSRTLHLCRSTVSGSLSIQRTACVGTLERYQLPLVESDRNDRLSLWESAVQSSNTTLPVYGAGGRVPGPRELNSLTKGCVAAADYNHDTTPDVEEGQAVNPALELAREKGWELWGSFAYFMELHESSLQLDQGPFAAGRMVIAERSRCDTAAFPLDYESAGPAAAGLPYWRECHRQPDARFDPVRAPRAPGFDFAQWSCDTPGSCGMAPFPHVANAGDPDGWLVPHGAVTAGEYGVCGSRRAGASVAWGDGDSVEWRGMHHHSQFKCVSLAPTPGMNDPSWVRTHADLNASSASPSPGHLDFQTCRLAGTYDHGAATVPPVDVECEQLNVSLPGVATVGWASIRYDSQALFQDPSTLNQVRIREIAGCVDESEWGGLCEPLPGAATGPMSIGPDIYHGDSADFGALLACGPVSYMWGVSVDPDAPPARTLIWDEGRWE